MSATDIHPRAHRVVSASVPTLPAPSHVAYKRNSSPRRINRPSPCRICFQRHVPLQCWSRGTRFQPLWLQRNVAKYNVLHPNEVLPDAIKNQPPPMRQALNNPQANKTVTLDDDVQSVDSIVEYHDTLSILPSEDEDSTSCLDPMSHMVTVDINEGNVDVMDGVIEA